jgi:ABC-type amino acid transport substrate-binding protein
MSRTALIRSVVAAIPLVLFMPWGGRAQAPESPPSRTLVVATKVAPPFAMKGENGAWTGISIELWRHIAAKRHWQTTFREYDTVPAMLDATASGQADAAVSAITVTGERERQVDFSQPFFSTGLGIAVPQQRELEWMPIVRGFISMRFVQVLGILVGTAMIVGSLIWLLERRHTEQYRNGSRGLGTGLWWAASAMMYAAPQDKAPATLWGRVVATLWMVASVILIASFTAGITAQLTTKNLTGRVRSEFDLIQVRTGTVANTSALSYLASQRVDPKAFVTAADGLQALAGGRLDAFVYDKPLLEYAVKQQDVQGVMVLPVVFDRQNYAIAVAPRSDLRTEIDLAMVDDLRTDWWREVLTRYLGPQ